MRFLLLALLLIPFACRKKEEVKGICTNPIKAKIVWSGLVAADGCDWLVKIDSVTFYHPETLDSAFRQNDLNVMINFIPTNQRFSCGFSNPGTGPRIIRITSITK